jgi:hypothetical protein
MSSVLSSLRSAASHRQGLRACRAVLLAALLLVGGCGDGLTPEMGLVGFEGRVTVASAFPPADSVLTLRVVAARSYPPKDILGEYIAGRLVFSDALVYNTRTQTYTILQNDLTGIFEYVCIAQQYGPNPFSQWRVVGVYSLSGDKTKYSPVDFGSGRYLRGIDMTVDFYDLPPQPF